jgi:integrase
MARSIVRAFFTFAVKRKHLDTNPVSAIDKVRLIGKAPEIFTPEVLAKVLAAAPRSLLPSLAIGAFAGLRTSELLRLNWSNVDLVRGFVHVQADRTKSARRRLVRISPNLMEWLRPFAGEAGAIYTAGRRNYHEQIGDLLDAINRADQQTYGSISKERLEPLKWPNNGLRHSFASYHLAQHQNAAQLALEMGHTTTRMIFENYRELVTPEAAALYWSIVPEGVTTDVAAPTR